MKKYTITIERTTRAWVDVEITAASAAAAIEQANIQREGYEYRHPHHDYLITEVEQQHDQAEAEIFTIEQIVSPL